MTECEQMGHIRAHIIVYVCEDGRGESHFLNTFNYDVPYGECLAAPIQEALWGRIWHWELQAGCA